MIFNLDKRLWIYMFIVIGTILGAFLSKHYGIRLNLSSSFSQDCFITKKNFKTSELQNGTIIVTRVDFENPYIQKGKLMIKRISCNSGDTLSTRGKDFFCNDQLIAVAQNQDSQSRIIEQFTFNGKIPDGYIFLTADNPSSYDSRYFGFLDKQKVEEIGIWSM